MINFDFFDLIT